MSDQLTPLGGTCSARFDPLRELFAAKLESGEDLGASVALKDRKSTRLNSSHRSLSRMPSSA